MYEELEDLLLTIVSPERTAVILNACTPLDDFGVTNHLLPLEEVMYNYEYIDKLDLVNQVETIIRAAIVSALNSFSVFTETTNITVASAMLTTLRLLPEFEDRATIIAICEADDDPETKLADLVELVTDCSSCDVLEDIKSVNHRLIERIIRIASIKEESVEEESVDRSSVDYIRKRLRAVLKDRTYIIAEAIAGNLPLGMDHRILMAKFKGQLEALTSDRVGEEVTTILMASDLQTSDITYSARYNEEILHDPNQVTAANAASRVILRESVNLNAQA